MSKQDSKTVTETEVQSSPVRKVLPLVTLRGLVVTPHANVQVLAARDYSIQAFRAAQDSDSREVAVFCQLQDNDDNPPRERLQQVGVICRVLNGDYKDSETFRCLIRGYCRVRLNDVIEEEGLPYRKAAVEVLEEKSYTRAELSHYVTTLKSSLEYAMKKSDGAVKGFMDSSIPHEILDGIRAEEDLYVLSDLLTQTLSLSITERRCMLETLDPVVRAKFLIARLNGYSYQVELEQRVVEEARASMERNQRDYFLNEQLKAIRHELGDDRDDDEVEEFRNRLKELKAPDTVKKRIEKEIRKYTQSSAATSEGVTIRNYIEVLLSVPWQESSPVNRDLGKARDILEHDHYGLEKVKERILEYLAVQSRADRLHGPILCLVGPPGIGKTSLGASIARATGRKYTRVALGGLHDEAEIRGHRRTYVGSLPGKIITNITRTGVNNPLFLLDEIDKITSTVHGDPEAALLEVLDPEQNRAFTDNYLEMEYDLSNVLFIATANSYDISAPLLDRMEIIDLSSYTEDEKFNIARKYLLPKQMRLNTLEESEFAITDAALTELIRYYTHEAGVRGLERLLNELCRKTVKDMLLKDSARARKEEDGSAGEAKSAAGAKKKRRRKLTLDVKDLEKMLGPRRYDFTSRLSENKVGLVNGLAWTSLGGDILQLEAVANEGTGKHILTGKLGDVMKESISAAMTLVRSRASLLHLNQNFFEKCDLHIHVPEGATPKEGPSAGVGMVTAIVSALTGNPVRADVAMTGEITLRGDVLPIGGLKEKLLAALRGGIKTVLIPKDNVKDLWDIPENVKKNLEIVPVGKIEEVLKRAMQNDPWYFIPDTVWSANNSSLNAGSGTDSAAATPKA